MSSQKFQELYELAFANGFRGTALMNKGAESINNPAEGRAWMTYEETRQGVGYMGEHQTHETAAATVSKFHKGF